MMSIDIILKPSIEIPKEVFQSYTRIKKNNNKSTVNIRAYATLPRQPKVMGLSTLLTVRPQSSSKQHRPRPYSVLEPLSERTYGLPRALGTDLFKINETRCALGASVYLKPFSEFKLRPYQVKACDAVCKHFAKKGPQGGLMLASCGSGKTVMAIEIIRRMGVRAAVVVHKDFLMKQWEERINRFFVGAKVGYVQRDRVEIEGYDIILCMVQTLSQRDYERSTMDSVGLVIYDETHHICAKTFSKSLRHFSARCRLGLTATPDRADGLGYLITWMIGPVLCNIRRRSKPSTQKANVTVFRVRSEISLGPMVFNRLGDPCFTSMITKLVNNTDRNKMLVHLLCKLVKEKRNILVASARRSHLKVLQKMLLTTEVLSSQEVGLYVGENTKSGKQKRDLGAPNWKVIFTTFQMGEEGLDLPHLDTLVITTPKKKIEQLVGRVTRNTESKGARVYDIDDVKICMFSGMHRKRIVQYTRLSCCVRQG